VIDHSAVGVPGCLLSNVLYVQQSSMCRDAPRGALSCV
jgi:hypothetical protein